MADSNWRDEHGHEAAYVAIRTGSLELMGVFGKGATTRSDRLVSRLVGACRRGDSATVDALLAATPELLKALTPADHAALCEAAWEGAMQRPR